MAQKFPVRENTGNLEILSKHRENSGNFVKTQGILFAQVVNGLILKIKDFAIFAAKKSRSWIGLPSQFCVCNSHKLCKLAQGKIAVRQGKNKENTGNLKIQFQWQGLYRANFLNGHVCLAGKTASLVRRMLV